MGTAYLDIASWQPLGEHQYRQVRLYESMRWGDDLELEDMILCAAPLGGPIAVARDSRKMTMYRKGGEHVAIYSAAGNLLAEVPCDEEGRLIQMAWSPRELLYCVYSNGAVDVFDVLGNRSDKCFSILPALTEEEIVQAQLAGDGMAALSVSPDGMYSLHLVYSLDTPTPLVAQDTGLAPGVRPTSMAIIESQYTSHGRMEVLLGTPERSIIVVSTDTTAVDAHLEGLLSSVLLMMGVSPGGKYVATLGEDGVLTVLDSAFERKMVEFETKATTPPEQLVWCGEDSVVLTWADKGLLLIGPFGDWLKFNFDEALHVVQESDCVRIITASHHEMIQRVPNPLRNIRSIGSTAPAAVLADASAAFQDGDAKCDDSIRGLLNDDAMTDAILECTQGATHEWDPQHQQSLLRAASYGKSFEPSFPRDVFTDSCRKLRILNHIRSSVVGVPLTPGQYDLLTPPVLVDRLMLRHEHRLALLVCDYLGLHREKDKVLVHWACAKVRASSRLSDEAVRDLLREKLSGVAGVSYADIAATADSAGRRRLATMLLDFEPRAADQVPILLKMREGRLALEKALDSGDSDLIYLALTHMRRSILAGMDIGLNPVAAASGGDGADGGAGGAGAGSGSAAAPLGDDGLIGPLDTTDDDAPFIKAVLAYPQAVDLLAAWAVSQDNELLLKLQLAAGRFVDAGRTLCLRGYAESDLKARITTLRKASEILRDGEKHQKLSSSARAQCGFFGRAVEEQTSLIIAQASIEDELEDKGITMAALGQAGTATGGTGDDGEEDEDDADASGPIRLVDMSLSDTLIRLIQLDDQWAKRAEKLAKEFKVTDSQYAHVKIRALAGKRDFSGLWSYGNERKNVVGYKPFAEACIAVGSNMEAKRYIVSKMSDREYADRMTLLLSMGGTGANDALELAIKAKDVDRLMELRESGLIVTIPAQDAMDKALVDLGAIDAPRRR